jgi:hypothetical protein
MLSNGTYPVHLSRENLLSWPVWADMHASAGAPTRAHDERRARRPDERCRSGHVDGGSPDRIECGRSLPGAMTIRLSVGLHGGGATG